MKFTHEQRKELSRQADEISSRYGRWMVAYTATEQEQARQRHEARYPGSAAPLIRAWRSRTHIAQLYNEAGNLRLSIQRVTDHAWHIRYQRDGGISWDELQCIKAECGYGDWWALEVYPPEANLIDVAPMRHLWLVAQPPAFAWQRERNVRP